MSLPEPGDKSKKLAAEYESKNESCRHIIEKLQEIQSEYYSLEISGNLMDIEIKFLGNSYPLKFKHNHNKIELRDDSDKPLETFGKLDGEWKQTHFTSLEESLGFILDRLV